MKIPIEYKIAFGFIITFLLVLAFGLGTSKNINSLNHFNQEQSRSQVIVKAISKTRAAMSEIESSSRGYALTGDPSFLLEYDENVHRAAAGWSKLSMLLKNDSFFNARNIILANAIGARITFSDSLIRQYAKNGMIPVSEFVGTRRGDRLTQKINRELDQLENYQYKVADLYNSSESNAANRSILLFSVLIALIVIVFSAIFILLKKDLKWRRKTAAEFKLLNESLEIKVEERVKAFAKAEQELIESRSKMIAVLENSSDSIWSIDKNMKLVSFNNSYFESNKLFFDITPYIGMNVLGHLNAEKKERWSKLYARALTGEHFSEETADSTIGLELFFDISFNPIIINNEVMGAAIFARDISGRKNVERQLEYKVNELNTFMYKATHDLRSPLVSVMGLAHLAKDQPMNEELLNYIDMISMSVHKMDNLLVDLVKIVNVSQGKLLTEIIDVDSIIDDILMSLSHYPDFSKIIFRRHVHADSVFRTDRRLLYSVLQNLIDNAIKYKRALSVVEPLIIITVDVTAHQMQIGITDNGIGIAASSKDKVFEMFYRATVSSNGTGLGLYIVKTSVEKMGGKISLSSIEGKGTSINVVLPDLEE